MLRNSESIQLRYRCRISPSPILKFLPNAELNHLLVSSRIVISTTLRRPNSLRIYISCSQPASHLLQIQAPISGSMSSLSRPLIDRNVDGKKTLSQDSNIVDKLIEHSAAYACSGMSIRSYFHSVQSSDDSLVLVSESSSRVSSQFLRHR